MKTRLITLLTMGHTLDGAKDRKGAYTLRNVNKFPKFGSVTRTGAGGASHASHAAPSVQPSLFEAPKAPVVVAPPKEAADGKDGTNGTHRTDQPQPPQPPRARKDWFRWFAKSGAWLPAAAAFLPRTAARAWGRFRSPAADSRPRAQGELALEKVTVLRNDLSDSDLVVVAVQPKAEEPRAAQAGAPEPGNAPVTGGIGLTGPARCAERTAQRGVPASHDRHKTEPAGNPWTRVTARWIKLKNPAEGGREAPEGMAGQGGMGPDRSGPAAERRGGQPQSAGQWAPTPP